MRAILLNTTGNYYKERFLFFLLLLSLPVFFISCVGRKPIVENEASKSPIVPNRIDSSLHKETSVIPGDFADPTIIRKDNVYFATGTSSEWAPHFPLYRSTDLLHWQPIRYVFSKTPSWTAASFW